MIQNCWTIFEICVANRDEMLKKMLPTLLLVFDHILLAPLFQMDFLDMLLL